MHALRRALTSFMPMVLVGLLAWPMPLAAQSIERPTNCTEVMTVGSIFMGQDCGEWASVTISGRVVMRRPWSRTNRASRAVRIRASRESRPAVAASAASTPEGVAVSPPNAGSGAESGGCHPAYRGCLEITDDLNCPEINNLRVTLIDVNNDPYDLDVVNGPGNGITCDDES